MTTESVKLPYYFYDLEARLPEGKLRWFDDCYDAAPSIIQPKDNSLSFQRHRTARNEAYSKWQSAFFGKDANGQLSPYFKPKNLRFQAIRVLAYKHSESHKLDWWEHYQDALFRVFLSPETVYCPTSGEHKQWYLLSPEDCYLVNRREIEKKGPPLPPRNWYTNERYLSANPLLRRARFIPVECCHHLRHETTAGVLPEGL